MPHVACVSATQTCWETRRPSEGRVLAGLGWGPCAKCAEVGRVPSAWWQVGGDGVKSPLYPLALILRRIWRKSHTCALSAAVTGAYDALEIP